MAADRAKEPAAAFASGNGFDGAWNPICPHCGGYMHTGHTSECPVTVAHKRANADLLKTMREARRVTR